MYEVTHSLPCVYCSVQQCFRDLVQHGFCCLLHATNHRRSCHTRRLDRYSCSPASNITPASEVEAPAAVSDVAHIPGPRLLSTDATLAFVVVADGMGAFPVLKLFLALHVPRVAAISLHIQKTIYAADGAAMEAPLHTAQIDGAALPVEALASGRS